MLVLEDSVQFELTVKNSRFLAEAFVVANAEAAREKLRNQRKRRGRSCAIRKSVSVTRAMSSMRSSLVRKEM